MTSFSPNYGSGWEKNNILNIESPDDVAKFLLSEIIHMEVPEVKKSDYKILD